VIWDADISSDVDDVEDVCWILKQHKLGKISLLGLVADSANLYSADCIYGLSKWIAPDIQQSQIGAYQGSDPSGSPSSSVYTQDISTAFGAGQDRTHYQDAIAWYRKTLAAQLQPVTIVNTGFATALDGLLSSAANAGGDGLPSGLSIITNHVKQLLIVAGIYPSGNEWNFQQTPAKWSDVLLNWPVPVIAGGIEMVGTVACGPASSAASSTNPLQEAFHDWGARRAPSGQFLPVCTAATTSARQTIVPARG
jgi:hypothetical protein